MWFSIDSKIKLLVLLLVTSYDECSCYVVEVVIK